MGLIRSAHYRNAIMWTFFVEIVHIQNGGSISSSYRDPVQYLDIYRERPVRLTARALVPVREHPKVKETDEGVRI